MPDRLTCLHLILQEQVFTNKISFLSIIHCVQVITHTWSGLGFDLLARTWYYRKCTIGIHLATRILAFQTRCFSYMPACFWAAVCKTVRPMLSDHCLSCLSVTLVYCGHWPNGLTDQDETWHAGRPWPWPHCVRWGPSSPSPKGAHIHCGQMAA